MSDAYLYVCPGCLTNGMAGECEHDERTWVLAVAMAAAVRQMHQAEPPIPPIEMAWGFIDDAEVLSGSVGEPPYSVEAFHPKDMVDYTTVGLVNGRYLFAVPNAEGDATAEFIGDCDGRLVIVPEAEPAEEKLPPGPRHPRLPDNYRPVA